MAVKGILQPKIETPGMIGFLLWARRDAPALYGALVHRFSEVARFEEALNAEDIPGGVSGFMDVLSSIGGSIGSAASSIGNFVVNNGAAIFSAAGGYFVASQQAKLANTQLALARATQPPAQTAYVTNAQGQMVPVAVQPSGTSYAAYNAATLPQGGILSTLSKIPVMTWLTGAAALATVVLLVKRR